MQLTFEEFSYAKAYSLLHRKILELIAQGLSNTQISERLVLSPKTVKNHITHIFSKMQVTDRTGS
ncbi:response regulator transcription factor [Cyanobacteria bacterium FACHB-63]|nr:response regulator transcription factor [Cyanobacteria bacterium FACHB-63]